jgi:Putative adhesin
MGPLTMSQTQPSGDIVSSFDTPQPTSVTIELAQGAVHLIATDRADTVVVVNPGDPSRQADVEAAQQTEVEQSGGAIVVKAPRRRSLGDHLGLRKGGSVEITVELPAGSRVRAKAGYADYRADGRLGDTVIESGAGDIRLDHTGHLRAVTGAGAVTVNRVDGAAVVIGAGDMSLGDVAGDVEVKSLNGRTWIGKVGGTLKVKSANGDIAVDQAHADISAKTANGAIQLGEVLSGSVVLETASGGLEVGIGAGTSAWVDARTRFGRVHNSLDAAEGPEPSKATVEVRARTSFGDIVIRRA